MTKHPEFTDRKMICKDCAGDWVYTSGEQFFIWSKELADPLRCPACRKIRKATINPEGRRHE